MVSILIPVFNVEEFLPQCLDSVLGQTYKDIQVVLMDDGSTDRSLDICRHYAQIDNRVEVYNHENQGVALTRNHLLEKNKGDFILFVDSDDWIEPDMVEILLGIAIQNNADIVNCGNVINDSKCDKSDETVVVLDQDKAVSLFIEHKGFRGSLWNKLIRTTLLRDVLFEKGISLGEDALFCWELLKRASVVVLSNQQYYHYRVVENSLTHSSFGPKKFSAYFVWQRICDDTEELWPQYSNNAKARFCIEMTLLLRNAAKSGYNYDSSIEKLQSLIRNYGHLVTKTRLSSYKMRLYGLMGCISYKVLRFI